MKENKVHRIFLGQNLNWNCRVERQKKAYDILTPEEEKLGIIRKGRLDEIQNRYQYFVNCSVSWWIGILHEYRSSGIGK